MEILKIILVLYFGTLLLSYYIFNKIFVDRETKTYRISESKKKRYFLIIHAIYIVVVVLCSVGLLYRANYK
ncbi:MAG TPA: hypothetical protein IAA34_06925 [Candidatus Enterococcus stercoripullorum]|nr:hypothetical protein [Candidatus Enterococcus stercoripullorum]